jgi:hypothetical protein
MGWRSDSSGKHLPRKFEAMSSNPSVAKKKKMCKHVRILSTCIQDSESK